MQTTIDQPFESDHDNKRYLFPMVVSGLLLLFLSAPWSWQHKAHAALHGLCAQTPSHTLLLGGTPLPFDSRMTGIYGGFISSMIVLIALGRHRAAKLPSWPAIAVLVLFVGALAVDGFNSLLLDLVLPNLYQPSNYLRLITGMATGLALATIVCYLFAVSLWQRPELRTPVITMRDLRVLLPAQLPFIALVLSGMGWLAFPLTLFLVAAAILVIASLVLVAIVLVRNQDGSFDGAFNLQGVATAAVIGAVTIMALLSSGRFLLEHLMGIRPLP